ncbi:MAG: ribosome silencing factor [Clostridia bacterium]|nr:ribosome silencing factor [Clostridia bacterium]
MDSKQTAILAAKILSDKKAVDITVIDISVKSTFADYFVLASGSSQRQIGTLRDEIDDRLAKENILPNGVEGKPDSGWILMDYGDVIVNILTADMRDRYNIEKVWGDCEFLQLDL